MTDDGAFRATWPDWETGPERMRFAASQLDQLVDAAVAGGRIPPWRRDHYLARLQAGGRDGGQAVMTLLRLTPAPPDVAASWRRDPRARAASRPAADPDDQLYAALYPTDEAAAAEAERRTRRQAREAARFRDGQDYDNTLTAASGGLTGQVPGAAPSPPGYGALDGDPGHEPVPGHGVVTTEHAHEHADHQGGQHTHPHVHRNDKSHAPGAGHDHGHGYGGPVAAGIDARRAARLGADPADPAAGATDEQLLEQLFGPPGR